MAEEVKIERTRTQELISVQEQEVLRRQKELEATVIKPAEADRQAVKDIHAQLETEFANFVKNFREIRKETFKVSEYIMDSESLTSVRGS